MDGGDKFNLNSMKIPDSLKELSDMLANSMDLQAEFEKIKDTNITTPTNPNSNANKVEKNAEKRKLMMEKDPRETVNLVFIGHVDAGKSTIGGHLLYLTGMVDSRTLEKYEREAKEKNRETWYLSWALDINAEEREKGKTVEVGKAFFETDKKRFFILDAPGHKGYVPNMITGAAQADIALLVISARRGEFETGFEKGGQTREHALIVKIAGVKQLVVLVNKMDDITVQWSKERYDEILEKLLPYLKRIGFKASEITALPISGFTGANLKTPAAGSIEAAGWFKGPSLIDFLNELPPMNQSLYELPTRLMVSDRFKDMGVLILTCKVISGSAMRGDSLVLLPARKNVTVASVLTLDEEELEVAKAGENVRLKIANIDENDVPTGSVLCHPDKQCPVIVGFNAQLMILECRSIISAGYRPVMHIHNVKEPVTLKRILRKIDKRTGEEIKGVPVNFVKQDEACVAQFRLENSVCAAEYSEFPDLGRLTLRDEGRTVAVGKIIKVFCRN